MSDIETHFQPRPISLWKFLQVWLSLGVQSFGGGTVTLGLIQRAAVDQYQWVSPTEFARYWTLVQIALGINLLALTTLIGRQVSGTIGIVIALFGLLFPSVTITILLTNFYLHIQHFTIVQKALHGIIPATVGLGLMTVFQIACPFLAASRRDGRSALILTCILFIGSGLLASWQHLPIVAILGLVGFISAFANWQRHRHTHPQQSKQDSV